MTAYTAIRNLARMQEANGHSDSAEVLYKFYADNCEILDELNGDLITSSIGVFIINSEGSAEALSILLSAYYFGCVDIRQSLLYPNNKDHNNG